MAGTAQKFHKPGVWGAPPAPAGLGRSIGHEEQQGLGGTGTVHDDPVGLQGFTAAADVDHDFERIRDGVLPEHGGGIVSQQGFQQFVGPLQDGVLIDLHVFAGRIGIIELVQRAELLEGVAQFLGLPAVHRGRILFEPFLQHHL